MRTLRKGQILKGLAAVLTFALLLAGAVTPAKAEGKSAHGFLGVSIENLSQENKDEFAVDFGVLVSDVKKGEAAEKAGIKKYDVIRFFNDEKIRRPADLIETVRDTRPGTKVLVKLVRDKKPKEITVTIGESKSRFARFDSQGGKNFVFYPGKGGGYLGVQLNDLKADLAEYFGVKAGEGVLIMEVEKESPAEKAGLKSGDVIVALDSKKTGDSGKVSKVVSAYEKGDEIEIKFIRHKKEMSIKVKLGENPGHHGFQIFKDRNYLKELEKFHVPGIGIYPHPGDEERIILREKESKEEIKKKIEEAKKKAKKEKVNVVSI